MGKVDLWASSTPRGGSGMSKARDRWIEQCAADPSVYFWGDDPETGLRVVRTKDAHDEEHAIKPLPDWPYLGFTLAQWATGTGKHIVDKPRQLMVSWLLVLWMDYTCIFKPHRRCLLNKSTQDEAAHMLFDRLGIVHQYWPDWFAAWVAAESKVSTGEMLYGRTQSSIAATGENVDDRAARGDQASVFGVDEAARHPRLREVVAAIVPMAKQIILVSTPEKGNPGSRYMSEILSEGQKGEES